MLSILTLNVRRVVPDFWHKHTYCAFASTLLLLSTVVCGNASGTENLIVNGDFGTGDLSGWSMATTIPAAGENVISYDGAEGVPAGSALFDRGNNPLAPSDNKDLLYQFVDVVVGKKYVVDAQWKGDLIGMDRNWAELLVTFLPTDADMPDGGDYPGGWIEYKKASSGGPNEPDADGWDWESVLASPNNADSPLDGVFTATDEYLLLAFNVGGRALATPAHFNVDNVSVTAFIPEPASATLLGLFCLTFGVSRFARVRSALVN